MSEYNRRRWRWARIAQAIEAVEEGGRSYLDIVAEINAGKYSITAEDDEEVQA